MGDASWTPYNNLEGPFPPSALPVAVDSSLSVPSLTPNHHNHPCHPKTARKRPLTTPKPYRPSQSSPLPLRFPAPQPLSTFYLQAFLDTLRGEGWTIFVVGAGGGRAPQPACGDFVVLFEAGLLETNILSAKRV